MVRFPRTLGKESYLKAQMEQSVFQNIFHSLGNRIQSCAGEAHAWPLNQIHSPWLFEIRFWHVAQPDFEIAKCLRLSLGLGYSCLCTLSSGNAGMCLTPYFHNSRRHGIFPPLLGAYLVSSVLWTFLFSQTHLYCLVRKAHWKLPGEFLISHCHLYWLSGKTTVGRTQSLRGLYGYVGHQIFKHWLFLIIYFIRPNFLSQYLRNSIIYFYLIFPPPPQCISSPKPSIILPYVSPSIPQGQLPDSLWQEVAQVYAEKASILQSERLGLKKPTLPPISYNPGQAASAIWTSISSRWSRAMVI